MPTNIVTVLMPVYNGAAFLSETINSILSQTYKNFDFLIINDGSTDESEKIILSYEDSRIKYVKNEKNMGIICTLNKGLDMIKSKYIVRMDADDVAFPHRIETQVEYMEKNPNMVVSGSRKLHFTGDQIAEKEVMLTKEEHHVYFRSIFNTSMPHPTIIIRNEIIQKFNLRYDKAYYGAEDKALWLQMAHHGDLGKLTDPLIKYRIHENQITSKKLEECRNNSVAITCRYLHDKGIILNELESRALRFICYPQNCGNLKMVKAILRLSNKLSKELKAKTDFEPYYIDKFLKTRVINIIVRSTSIGIPLIGVIVTNLRYNIFNFNLSFYKRALTRSI